MSFHDKARKILGYSIPSGGAQSPECFMASPLGDGFAFYSPHFILMADTLYTALKTYKESKLGSLGSRLSAAFIRVPKDNWG
jgi:hypothetical protein